MSRKSSLAKVITLLLAVAVCLSLTGCLGAQNDARVKANAKAKKNEIYVGQNNVDLDIYNMRQEMADDPSTILWVTCMFPSPSSPIITVPVVGKLVSSNKTPMKKDETDAGPDGMYGTSAEFRYGFGPNGISEYFEFFNISTFATTMPTVWQAQKTTLVMEDDPILMDASKRAKEAVANGDSAKAREILLQGIKDVQESVKGGE